MLIVEDDPMVAELNKRYLEKIPGFNLAGIVNRSEQALGFLENNSVDLILLDIFMPGTDGFGLLSAIRRQQYGVDVILVTAARDKDSIQKALRNGVFDYLIKPFEFARFQAALLNYQKQAEVMIGQRDFCQRDLDEQIFYKSCDLETGELPKGIERNTMKAVWEQVLLANGDFSAEEMADLVGMSQVSMRKYLKYFQQKGLISAKISYGAVGRPVARYQRTT